ncbi:hypothetical protein HYQ46_010077 [Verticillium longisporum]|nr:hypothetical protein HYQ46_010077 [Verticillium longisporum]
MTLLSRRTDAAEEIVLIAIALTIGKEPGNPLRRRFGLLGLLLGVRGGFGLLLGLLGGSAVDDLLFGESEVLNDRLPRVIAGQSLHHKPVGLLLFSHGLVLVGFADADQVAGLQRGLKLLRGSADIRVNRERGNDDLGSPGLARLWLEDDKLAAKAKGGTNGRLNPLGGFGQGERGALRLGLRLVEKVLSIQLVLLLRSLRGGRVGVLQRLNGDLAVESCRGRQIRVLLSLPLEIKRSPSCWHHDSDSTPWS